MSHELSQSSSSSSSSAAQYIKTVKFALGKGNKTDGKLVVVHKRNLKDDVALSPEMTPGGTLRIKDKQKMRTFIDNVLLHEHFLGSKLPKVLISVTGAAADFNLDPKLEQIFGKGLVNAAKSTTAWIVSGGTDVGVMHFVGEANRRFVTDVPTIGFATYNMINNKHLLKTADKVVTYDATAGPMKDGVNLNANHSHFVLIESDVNNWGEEIEARSDFEEYMCTTFQLPLCLVVVNGGPGTLRTVAEGAMRKFSVVLFEGTGRAADAIAREIRRKRGLPYEHIETMKLNNEQLNFMSQIVDNSDYVTLYSAEEGPFDLSILKSILSSAHGSLSKKLELAVEWNRADLAEHLLDAANKDNSISPEELSSVLSKAMELSLDLEKPDLFSFLADKGAQKTNLDLTILYTKEHHDGRMVLDPLIMRYVPHLSARASYTGILSHASSKYFRVPTVVSPESPKSPSARSSRRSAAESKLDIAAINCIKEIFCNVDPMFVNYAKLLKQKLMVANNLKKNVGLESEISLQNVNVRDESVPKSPDPDKASLVPVKAEDEVPRVKYTDALLWAILTGKLDLAKVIWEKTTLPVHTALIASGLCKGVAKWLLNEQVVFLEAADWFENVALSLLEKMDYDDAILLFECDYDEFNHNCLDIAIKTECKEFASNRHVQRYLDGLLYSDEHGGIPPGTNMAKVISCIMLPFLLYVTKTYDHENAKKTTGRWYHFYGLPYTKFWTSTMCYLGYLILLAFVLVGFQGSGPPAPAEILLWIWMFGIGIEEISQWQEEGWSYFKYVSNRMDIFILVVQAAYFGLAIATSFTDSTQVLHASTDLLIVATIISYVRFLDVFSISKELGPLYVVLQKIIGDVIKWIFVFLLFAISFQVSFMAITNQVDEDSTNSVDVGVWQPTIYDGTFLGAYFTIIGDYDSTMGILSKNTFFGPFLVSIYALIAQIMLVNLLIAMMGDTFNSVKENSDKEWKFSRYSLITEYTSASFHPPPFNIVVIPFKKLYYFTRKAAAVDLDAQEKEEISTRKQREQFKNLMKDMKENHLAEVAAESLNTIQSVSENVRESFKTLIEEQEAKNISLDQKLTELANKTQAISINSGGGAGLASVTNDLKMEMNYMKESVNTVVKQEISALHKTLLDAIKSAQAPALALPVQVAQESVSIPIQGREVPVTWSAAVKPELVTKVLREYKPFQEWVNGVNKPNNAAHFTVNSIMIHHVDMFGPRIGFVKFQAVVVNEDGKNVAGVTFMRGGAVGMLVVLKLNEPGDPEHGKEFTIVTIQPRIPVAEARFTEIPAGMIDGGHFAGAAARELREETGIDIKEEDLIDLTGLTYNGKYQGMYPSAGGCDEVIGLYLYRTTMNREQLNSYHNKLTGLPEENEIISLKVLPLDELWVEAPDAKALSALYLYHALTKKGLIPPDY